MHSHVQCTANSTPRTLTRQGHCGTGDAASVEDVEFYGTLGRGAFPPSLNMGIY